MNEEKKLLTKEILLELMKKPGHQPGVFDYLFIAICLPGAVLSFVVGVISIRRGDKMGLMCFFGALMFGAVAALVIWLIVKHWRLCRKLRNGTSRPVVVECVKVYHTRKPWDRASKCPSTVDANGKGSYIMLTFRGADGQEYQTGFFADASEVYQGDRFYILKELGVRERWSVNEWTLAEDLQ